MNRQSQADDGSTTWDDSLLVSDDGGATVNDVLRQQAALLGFCRPMAKRCSRAMATFVVAPTVVDPDVVGLYAATSDALTFTQNPRILREVPALGVGRPVRLCQRERPAVDEPEPE